MENDDGNGGGGREKWEKENMLLIWSGGVEEGEAQQQAQGVQGEKNNNVCTYFLYFQWRSFSSASCSLFVHTREDETRFRRKMMRERLDRKQEDRCPVLKMGMKDEI